jgi:hypothetical protein
MVYSIQNGTPAYFPFMNDSMSNPDGDIQIQQGYVYNDITGIYAPVLLDSALQNVPELDVLHFNAQAAGLGGTIDVLTIREYSELAANGWNIDYSTLKDPYHTQSPLAKWYKACFDVRGVFTTSKDSKCKFDVTPGVVNY